MLGVPGEEELGEYELRVVGQFDTGQGFLGCWDTKLCWEAVYGPVSGES